MLIYSRDKSARHRKLIQQMRRTLCEAPHFGRLDAQTDTQTDTESSRTNMSKRQMCEIFVPHCLVKTPIKSQPWYGLPFPNNVRLGGMCSNRPDRQHNKADKHHTHTHCFVYPSIVCSRVAILLRSVQVKPGRVCPWCCCLPVCLPSCLPVFLLPCQPASLPSACVPFRCLHACLPTCLPAKLFFMTFLLF